MSTEHGAISEIGRWLAEKLAEHLGASLEAMTSEAPSVRWRAPEPGDSLAQGPDAHVWRHQPFTGLHGAGLILGAPESSCIAIGRFALEAAGLEDVGREDSISTWREIEAQALSAIAQEIGRRLRIEVGCDTHSEPTETPEVDSWVVLEVEMRGEVLPLRLGWKTHLERALDPDAEPEDQAAEAGQSNAPATAQPGALPAAVEKSRTLGLLLEVEMPLSISFGRAQLPLRDILKLNTGSIVELNRAISEPVELIVNNCVIARGEVVVVEGNYGVRIRQIISKEERLRTLY